VFPERPDEVLVGSKAAEKLHLKTGNRIPLLGRDFTVSATLYETGSDDDTVIFMDLTSLQELTGKPGATSFIQVAALCSGCPIEDIVAQLQENLPGVEVKALQQVINQRMTSIHFVQKLALGISVVILVTAAAMVGLSMMSAVNERKKDIGILRSLGYGKPQVFLIFCLEAGLIGIFSGGIGYLVGFAASFQVLGFLHMAEGGTPIFSSTHLLVSAGLFSLVTVLAAVYPAWKGAGVEPSAALVAL
jgi:putative ABC transport system permease protein